ncbi:hypothetical protein WS62_10110 [Burkholderia sp. ABCPW 14]|uniref:putative sulfate exporter family transporter n=1 Tax=Burkholderia sp. ABCPW 14 TaxID=1637860 RepID=UPI000770C7EA|nr:putative sulfate exporter family transporter [Burkholderia sp. ABCPW 14]KVD71605.1 hypothetical protein WS62_10110 [Burkholderia sp. ABCPW 14]
MSGSRHDTAHADALDNSDTGDRRPAKPGMWRELISKEDGGAIWVGLGLVLVAYVLFAGGGSIRGLAVAPAKWSSIGQAARDLGAHLPNYVALFVVFGALFSISIAALGQKLAHFVPVFVLAIVATTRWERADGIAAQPRASEIRVRFPKFVIGFVVASAFVTWVASHDTLADYRKIVTPHLVAPITVLRTWAFIFCFFSIGLTTRLKSLSATGVKPVVAFTAGVVANVIVGYLLSVRVFGHYWATLGQ